MISGLKYSAKEIAEIVGGKLVGEDVIINALSIDTREKFSEKTCFFAIKGERFNGADFICQAEENGAQLIVTQKDIVSSKSVIYVDDAVKALGSFAKHHKGKTKVIAVTGSVGKTTVKDMLALVLSEKYSVASTYKNYNNEIGVALTLLSLKNEDFCVVEMGMRGRGQIDYLASISNPDVSVITNCGSAHIGILGSRKNIFRAKTEILKHTSELSVVPNEKRFVRTKRNVPKKEYVGKGTKYCSTDIRYTNEGITFNICGMNDVKIECFGTHNARNFEFVYVLGKYYSLSDEEIRRGIGKYRQESGRGKILNMGELAVIDDTYNASYEGMRESIKSLAKYCKCVGKEPLVLLGDMCEQGKKAAKLHRDIGLLCKKLGIKSLYTVGENSSYYIKGYGGGKSFESLFLAYDAIREEAVRESALLLKASRALGFEKIIEWMKEENVKQ